MLGNGLLPRTTATTASTAEPLSPAYRFISAPPASTPLTRSG